MVDSQTWVFMISIAWLMAHEMDAILRHEWRMFFFLAPFSEVTAYRIFVIVHIPLVALILAAMPNRNFQIAFDSFLIFHAGLHWVLRNHPKYEFKNWFSVLLIFGVVPLSALHLAWLLTA
jgi:hypothetical protein